MPAASPMCSSTRCSAASCDYLRGKPAAFRVIDTHAGAGLYDLTGAEASRGGEWHDGIERVAGGAAARAGRRAAGVLSRRDRCAQSSAAASASIPARRRSRAPGLRPQDRLIACELEPKAAAALGRHLHGDDRIKTLAIDGWTALSAYVPPTERRGLVLVDPPFEAGQRFPPAADGLAGRTANGPPVFLCSGIRLKDRREPDALAKRLRRLGIAKILRAELIVSRRSATRPG